MSDEEFIPTLTHATERDIDLLLVEELYASSRFVTWMAAQVGIRARIVRSTVLHSKRRTRSRREIDIFIDIRHADGSASALLIENKLDATEQPDQAESYRQELELLTEKYPVAAMLIVCPSAYSAEFPQFTSKFDGTVTYEGLADYFLGQRGKGMNELEQRYAFRASLIQQAVYKHRRGYTPIPNKMIGDFNARYVSLLAEVAPEIRPGKSMLKPANPNESTSMIFDLDASLEDLPHEIRPRRFAHELGRGSERRANYVAVTFAGWGSALPAMRERMERDARELGARFDAKSPTKIRPNPGLVMSVPAAPVDNQGDFDAQRLVLISGIEKARDLRHWLIVNQKVLRNWKRLAEAPRQTDE